MPTNLDLPPLTPSLDVGGPLRYVCIVQGLLIEHLDNLMRPINANLKFVETSDVGQILSDKP